ncbi:hypothetical protein BC673_101124 [Prevotella pallens]|uniref:Uncharacterized protein n=1 Tax=Prevotella pallens TaxID=60133 RepID=A0ABX9DWX3_9BACT|nr:hypothetical protein BC673_101124 [Prevotella pallens]
MQNSPHSCLFLTPTPYNCGEKTGTINQPLRLTVCTWTYITHNKYTQRCARGHILHTINTHNGGYVDRYYNTHTVRRTKHKTHLAENIP